MPELTIEELRALAAHANNPRWTINLERGGGWHHCVEFDMRYPGGQGTEELFVREVEDGRIVRTATIPLSVLLNWWPMLEALVDKLADAERS